VLVTVKVMSSIVITYVVDQLYLMPVVSAVEKESQKEIVIVKETKKIVMVYVEVMPNVINVESVKDMDLDLVNVIVKVMFLTVKVNVGEMLL